MDRSSLSDRRSGTGPSRLTPTVKYLDTLGFRTKSKALDEYHRRDFSGVKSRLTEVFGETANEMVPRPLPLVHRYAVEIADAYVEPPIRAFSGVTEAQAAVLARWYQILGMDEVFLLSQELLTVQGTYLGLLLPRNDGRRGFVPQLFRPWECEVVPDPRDPGSLSSAREIRVRVPVAAGVDSVQFGVLTMTPQRIVIDTGSGTLGVWNEEGTNPFGGLYPAWHGRIGSPTDGSFYGALAEDLLRAQESLILSATDSELVSRYQSYGSRYVSGDKDAEPLPEGLTLGPNGVTVLPQGWTMGITQPQPTLAQYDQNLDQYLRLEAQLSGINWEGLTKGYVSALSRLMANADRTHLRLRHRMALRAAEARFLRALMLVLSWGGDTLGLPADTGVSVEFRELRYPTDPQAEAQGVQARIALGLESPAEVIARERRVSLDEAERIYKVNIAAVRAAREGTA